MKAENVVLFHDLIYHFVKEMKIDELKIRKDGIKAMTEDSVAMPIYKFDNLFPDDWEDTDINASYLLKFLSQQKKSNELTYERKDSKVLVTDKEENISYKIPVIDIEEYAKHTEPKLEAEGVSFDIDIIKLRKHIEKLIRIVDKHVSVGFKLEDKTISLYINNDNIQEINIDITKDVLNLKNETKEKEVVCRYNIGLLKNLLANKSLKNNINLSYKKDYPLQARAVIGKNIKYRGILAPRTEH